MRKESILLLLANHKLGKVHSLVHSKLRNTYGIFRNV